MSSDNKIQGCLYPWILCVWFYFYFYLWQTPTFPNMYAHLGFRPPSYVKRSDIWLAPKGTPLRTIKSRCLRPNKWTVIKKKSCLNVTLKLPNWAVLFRFWSQEVLSPEPKATQAASFYCSAGASLDGPSNLFDVLLFDGPSIPRKSKHIAKNNPQILLSCQKLICFLCEKSVTSQRTNQKTQNGDGLAMSAD